MLYQTLVILCIIYSHRYKCFIALLQLRYLLFGNGRLYIFICCDIIRVPFDGALKMLRRVLQYMLGHLMVH